MKEMKKFLLALLVVAVPMTFAACSDDDDPAPEVKLAETVKGTYKGTYTVKVAGEQILGEDEKPATYDINVTFDATADNTATVKIGTLKLAVGEMDVEAVVGDIKEVALTGEEKKVLVANQKKKVDVTVKGVSEEDMPLKDIEVTLEGSVTDAKTLVLSATLDITGVGKVEVAITGAK